MEAYWYSLTLLQQILLVIALPSSLLLIIQFFMIIFGLGQYKRKNAQEEEGRKERGLNYFKSLKFITVRGIAAFLSIGAWAGVLAVDMGAASVVAVIIALAAGAAALVLMAAAFSMD